MLAGAGAEAQLLAGMRLGHHRGPGRGGTASNHRPVPCPQARNQLSGLPHSSPRTVVQYTVTGCWLSRPMEKDSNLRLQIQNLMLYPTELSVVQTKGIEPPTSGFFIRCSTAELRPRSDLRSGAVHRAGNTACAGGDESSNRCARSGFRDRERAYSPCGGLSQAALSWRTCGFLRWWYFGNSRRAGNLLENHANPAGAEGLFQLKMMRPRTRSFSPSTPTITASPSRAPAPVSAMMFSRWVTSTRLPSPL